MRLSTTTLARASARRPWLTLALWAAALIAAAAVIVLVLPGTLTAQYSFLGNPDSQRGRDLLQQRMNMPQKANEVVIVRYIHDRSLAAPLTADDLINLTKSGATVTVITSLQDLPVTASTPVMHPCGHRAFATPTPSEDKLRDEPPASPPPHPAAHKSRH